MDVQCVLPTKKPTLLVLLAAHVLQVSFLTMQPNHVPVARPEPRVTRSHSLVIPGMNPLRTVWVVNCAEKGIRNRQVEMLHVRHVQLGLNLLRISCHALFVQLESIVHPLPIISAFLAPLSAHARHRR